LPASTPLSRAATTAPPPGKPNSWKRAGVRAPRETGRTPTGRAGSTPIWNAAPNSGRRGS
jgi:hypothetical protein